MPIRTKKNALLTTGYFFTFPQFSVSTQLTTRSDRLAAAAAARAAVSRHKRYAGLTPVQFLDGADMSMLLHEAGVGAGREKTKIAKQVGAVLFCGLCPRQRIYDITFNRF